MSLWFSFDFLAFLTPFTCRSLVVPALLHAAIETFRGIGFKDQTHCHQRLFVFEPWLRTSMSYKFLILYLGRKHRSPAGKGLGQKPIQSGKTTVPMGDFTGEKPQYSGALGLQMLSLWSSFIEPPSVENSVSMLPNCCGEQVRHPRAMEFCEKLQKPKKQESSGTLW